MPLRCGWSAPEGRPRSPFHEATRLELDGKTLLHTMDWPEEGKTDISRYFRIPSAVSGELTVGPQGVQGFLCSHDMLE